MLRVYLLYIFNKLVFHLSKNYHSYSLFKLKTFESFTDNTLNGTVVVVVTPETISMLNKLPTLNFSNLQTAKPNRYYVDDDDLLADHNTRVKLIGGDVTWIRANLDREDTKSLQSIFREIVHSTVRGADAETVGKLLFLPTVLHPHIDLRVM